MPKPKHNLTYSEALQLRALCRLDKIKAKKEPDLRLRMGQIRVANVGIRKAQSVLKQGSRSPT